MNFIILGDKFQKRMKSKGCVGLIKHQNKSIIQYQYQIIKKWFPECNIVYVYGFDGKRFINFLENSKDIKNIITIYNANYEQYNHAYSLFLAKQYLEDDCFIVFGDNVIKSHYFSKFDRSKGSRVFIDKNHKHQLGCIIDNNKIENIMYDLNNSISEIYFLSKNHAIECNKIISNSQYHNCFIFEILNKLIDNSNNIISPFYHK